jgi:signal transduction histidine kinase
MRFSLWPRTLAWQLIAVTAAAVVISNFGVALWFEYSNQQLSQTSITDRMLDRAQAVATTLAAVTPPTRAVVMDTMSSYTWRFREIKGPYDARPMDETEAGLAKSLATQLQGRLPGLPAPIVHLHEPVANLTVDQRPWRAGGHDDLAQIIIWLDKDTLLSAVNRRNQPPPPFDLIMAALAGTILVSLAAALMARRVVRPLSELTRAASLGATSGGIVPRVPETGPEDVRMAATAFNAMTEKVKRTLESQRHLLSAVGHDLRTPITAMRINLEFVEDDDLREGLMRNLDELQDLTEQVLGAARGTGGETKRNVDLSALVESLCTDLDEMGEPVKWDLHVTAPISCRPNEIRRAVRNLVENAVAYGGQADVRIADMPDAYEVVVEDQGPGIPDEDHQRVFEPFVRLESSRNREGGGTGLGLTLVKAIAEGHGGVITLENRPEGGLRARMRLPRMGVPA